MVTVKKAQSSLHTCPPLLPALITLFIAMSFLLPALSKAETFYVKPTSEAAVRTGQGTTFKILAMVKQGSAVEFIKEENSYVMIRLKNGVEGWILKRFLSTEPPLTQVVESLRQENIDIGAKAALAAEELQSLSLSFQQTTAELNTLLAEKEDLNNKYQSLLSETADVMEIKRAQQSTAKENQELTEQLTLTLEENKSLKKDKTMHWFLAGAGVFLGGILIGKLPTPSRRRKSSLL